MALTRYKHDLLRRKEFAGVEFRINREDITFIVNQALADSFTCIVHNKSAIKDQGWHPLNYNSLLHPESAAAQYTWGLVVSGGNNANDDGSREDVMIPAEGLHGVELLHFSKWLLGSLIDEILKTRACNDAPLGMVLILKKTGTRGLKQQHKSSAWRRLILLDFMWQRSNGWQVQRFSITWNWERRSRQLSFQVVKRRSCKSFDLSRARLILFIKALNKIPAEMSVSELEVMVMWHKKASNLPAPTTKAALIERLHATIGRDVPFASEIQTLHCVPQPPAVADPMVHNKRKYSKQQTFMRRMIPPQPIVVKKKEIFFRKCSQQLQPKRVTKQCASCCLAWKKNVNKICVFVWKDLCCYVTQREGVPVPGGMKLSSPRQQVGTRLILIAAKQSNKNWHNSGGRCEKYGQTYKLFFMRGLIFMFQFEPIIPKRGNEVIWYLNEYQCQNKNDSIAA